MFSKPLVIAYSVASANAALWAVTSTANDDTTNKSDATGCGFCLSLTTSRWLQAGATTGYSTPASAATVAIATNTLTGDICCKSADTQETAGTAKTYCTGAYADNAANTKIEYSATSYFQSTLAQCPHNLENCTATPLKKDKSTAIALTDKRYVPLDDLGSYVTLSMKVVAAPGTAPALKQRKGDVCTWVVAGKCDAPVLTVPSTSGAITTATPEFAI